MENVLPIKALVKHDFADTQLTVGLFKKSRIPSAVQDLTFNVLKGQTVTVEKAAAAYDGNIVFNAYLTQATGFDTALLAWNATFGAKA